MYSIAANWLLLVSKCKSHNLTLASSMEQRALKNANNCLNTNIYSYLETSGGQSSNLHLNFINCLYTRVNKTCVAAQNSCFPALVSNVHCSIDAVYHCDMESVSLF
jgi:hypothetical protein